MTDLEKKLREGFVDKDRRSILDIGKWEDWQRELVTVLELEVEGLRQDVKTFLAILQKQIPKKEKNETNPSTTQRTQ